MIGYKKNKSALTFDRIPLHGTPIIALTFDRIPLHGTPIMALTFDRIPLHGTPIMALGWVGGTIVPARRRTGTRHSPHGAAKERIPHAPANDRSGAAARQIG